MLKLILLIAKLMLDRNIFVQGLIIIMFKDPLVVCVHV